MARTRSAHHTIAGYHYQFDKSLIEIMKAGVQETVTLEGIEDIDLTTETIQCKYHASQKYVPSQIKSPLLAFLTHYSLNRTSFTYTLYAHFNEGSLPSSFTVSEIRSILGTSLDSLNLSEADLITFLQSHLRCVAANNIDNQRVEALALICSVFRCTPEEAEDYYYGNALHEIMRLSRQSTIAARQVTRLSFISTINRKQRLFSQWLTQLKGEANYEKHVREILKRNQALSSTKQKHFVIHADLVLQSGVSGMVTLCHFLVERFYKVGDVLWNAIPPTVVLDTDEEMLLEVKRELLAQKFMLNDGFEHLSFQAWSFDLAPVTIRSPTRSGRPTDKLGRASYVIRLLSLKTFEKHKANLRQAHVSFVTGNELNGSDYGGGEILRLYSVADHTTLIAILQ